MNYFEYQDFPKLDKTTISITTDAQLQTGSSVDQLVNGIKPYDYATFEKDAYITTKPKKLAPPNALLGLITKNVTDSNGNGSMYVQIDLNGVYSFSGIYLEMVNLLKVVTISYYDENDAVLKSETFQPNTKREFFEFKADSVSKVRISFDEGTVEPYHFMGVTRIDLGKVRIFDASKLVNANVITHFDADGTTLQYDIAEFTIFTGEEDIEYLFQKKQPIVYKDTDNKILHKFYLNNAENVSEYEMQITAYDSVSLLEDEYLGGIYGFAVKGGVLEAPTTTYKSLIDDILSGTGVEYEIEENIQGLELKGYIPICTRRKALAIVLKGTNTRVFKIGGKLIFKHINDANEIALTDNNVVENPALETYPKIGRLTVIEHTYQKDTETVDLYNWYLRQGENTMQRIDFSDPVYKIFAYEVIGVDENGNDIISETSSTNVVFYHAPVSGGTEVGDDNICNYCIVKSCFTDNKVVIRGHKIFDDKNDNVYVESSNLDSNADYEDIEVEDVTITTVDGGALSVAKTLFTFENQKKVHRFMTVETEDFDIGDSVTASMIDSPVSFSAYDKNENLIDLEHKARIIEIEDDLSGIYRVVAQ